MTVTSADTTSSTVYRVTIWRLAAVTPRIVGLSETTTSVFGGDRTTITLADAQLPSGCDRVTRASGQPAYRMARVFDPTTGLTRDVVRM